MAWTLLLSFSKFRFQLKLTATFSTLLTHRQQTVRPHLLSLECDEPFRKETAFANSIRWCGWRNLTSGRETICPLRASQLEGDIRLRLPPTTAHHSWYSSAWICYDGAWKGRILVWRFSFVRKFWSGDKCLWVFNECFVIIVDNGKVIKAHASNSSVELDWLIL